jgi:ADP-ribose pyrophosphatase
MELYEKKIRSKNIFSGKIIKLYLDDVMLPNKKTATREKVSHPGAVGIVPVTKKNKVVLVEQFRYPAGATLLEIPAGKLDNGEDPIVCAERELSEEVGAVKGRLIHLATFYTSPGFADELLYLYLAVDFKREENNLDDDEFLHVYEIELEKTVSFIKEGRIKDAKTIIGIFMARDYLSKIASSGKRNKK